MEIAKHTKKTLEYSVREFNNYRYAILYFTQPTVTLAMCEDIISTIHTIESDSAFQAVIITSKLKLFSGGLDLEILLDSSKEEFKHFWLNFRLAWLALWKSRLYLLFAINGHCYAGGSVFSMTGDKVFMAEGKSLIGLNEVQVGLPCPIWICKTLTQQLGSKTAEHIISLGKLFSVDDALKFGFISAKYPVDRLLDLSVQYIHNEVLSIANQQARSATKSFFRTDIINYMDSTHEIDCELSYTNANTELTRQTLNVVRQMLKKSKL